MKYLPGIKLLEILGEETDLNEVLNNKVETCIFSYKNEFTSEMKVGEIGDMMCELLDIIRIEESSKFVNFPALILVYVFNIPPNLNIYESLRLIISGANSWVNPIFNYLKFSENYEKFCSAREKILIDDELLKNSLILHEIKVLDCSNLN